MKTKIVYTNTRDNKTYVFEPQLQQGDKVCLIAPNGDHKFVAPATLKRWYYKTEQVVETMTVSVVAFTGMFIGRYEGKPLPNGNLEVIVKNGNILQFDPATGVQTNARNPKFANRISWMV